MIPKELAAQAVRLYFVEKWPIGTIARHLRVHHSTVARALREHGVPADVITRRRSQVDPYLPFILVTLEKWPDLPASRLYAMVRERGYPGAPDHFRSIVARYRPKKAAEAFLRLRTLPGEQAQVDWAFFGSIEVDGAHRPLVAFVMVLSWSRRIFLRFGLDARTGTFLHRHVEAFHAFGGVPRIVLYDNLKSAVIERHGDAIHFNDQLLDFAATLRYEPRPVAPYRGSEKGRVERAIRYIRDNFWPARTFKGLADLNAQAEAWCAQEGQVRRCPGDRTITVALAFEEEQPRLLPLPDDPVIPEDRLLVSVGKTPYVRFDRNDYSVPHDRVRRALVVLSTPTRVRILDGATTVAEHERCWGKGRQVEDPAHITALVEEKHHARQARGVDRVVAAVPRVEALLCRVAERGGALGTTVAALGRLLDMYGAAELAVAVDEAMAADAPHLHAIRQVLDRRRATQGKPPPVHLPVPAAVADLSVRPHDLSAYDRIGRKNGGDHE